MSVRPFYIKYTPDMTGEQVAAVFDKAVAAGAILEEGVRGVHLDEDDDDKGACCYVPSGFNYFGVNKFIQTYFNQTSMRFGKEAQEIRLDQVDEWLGIAPKPAGKFPDFDFKISCGDDPRVRQWLHDNGCRPLPAHDQFILFVESKHVQTCFNRRAFFDRDPLPQINPFDYMEPQVYVPPKIPMHGCIADATQFVEKTVAERMAALIDKNKEKIPDWARWVAVDDGGLYAYQHAPKLMPGGFWPSSEKVERVQKQIESFLLANWRETLTELPTVKRGLMVEDKPACNMAEIAARDEREMSPAELRYAQNETRKRNLALFAKQQQAEPLTIPSICLAEPTSHMMMLGGEHGGRCGE